MPRSPETTTTFLRTTWAESCKRTWLMKTLRYGERARYSSAGRWVACEIGSTRRELLGVECNADQWFGGRFFAAALGLDRDRDFRGRAGVGGHDHERNALSIR